MKYNNYLVSAVIVRWPKKKKKIDGKASDINDYLCNL